MLATQTLGPSTFNNHLVVREQKRNSRKRSVALALMLTPLVDCFSMLVIFLLQTFSASPQMAVVTKGVQLPAASSGIELSDAPVLSISPEQVYLDQKPVGDVDTLLKNPNALMTELSNLRELWMKTHPNDTFKGEITLQAHYEISSATISRFMAMLPSQHYGLIQLAVVAGGMGAVSPPTEGNPSE